VAAKVRRSPSGESVEGHRDAGTHGGSVFVGAVIGLLAVAVALRLVGMAKDLWLDEIWSVTIATGLQSPAQALTLHHEINQYLNTMWLWAVGVGRAPPVYRLVSFTAGTLCVAVAGLIGRRRSRAAAVIMMLVFGFSYELVLYSSEARGYSTLVFFSLASFFCLERCLTEGARPRWVVGYGVCTLFGILSHPAFATVIVAGLAWTTANEIRRGQPRTEVARLVLRIHAAPLLCFALLYLIDMRFIVPGGGTPAKSLIDSYGTAFAWTVGTFQWDAAALISCVAAVYLLDLSLRREASTGTTSWVFFAIAIVFPIVPVLVRGSDLVYTRHFLIASVALLTIAAFTLASWWAERKRARCVVLLAAYCAVNGWHIAELAVRGRGQYREAMRYMVDQTPGDVLTIGADQDFRIGMELRYYLPQELGGKRAQFVSHDAWPPTGPQWLITQRENMEAPSPVADHITDPDGHDYELMEVFPTAPMSGLHWYVYRNRSLR
jgi:hypothetical protein